MAIQWMAGDTFTCLSTDTKPTLVPANTKAIETDTDDTYKFSGTAWALFSGAGGGGGLSAGGQISFSGNASQTVFNIPHGLSQTPDFVSIEPASTDSFGSFTTTKTSTNIVITYQIPPPLGSSNVTFQWGAGDVGAATGGLTASSTTTFTNKTIDVATNTIKIPSGFKYYIYLDAADSKFKALNGKTGIIDYISTDATDAAPTIRSAISASSNAPGKILLAPDTTFPLTTTVGSPARNVTIPSGIWLQGSGWSSKLQGAGALGAGAANVIINPRDATDCIVSDLCIDGQNTNGSANSSASGGNLHCVNVDRMWVHNVKSINSPERGINAYNCKYVNFSNNYVEVTSLEGSPDYLGYAGLQSVQTSEECVMCNNIIKNPGGPAIGVNATTKKVQIIGNVGIVTSDSPLLHERGRGQIHVETLGAGITRDSELIIANNNINSNYFGCILMGSFHADIHDNIFNSTGHETNPNVLANDYSGVKVLGQGLAFNIKIHHNDIYNIKGHGIYVNNPVGMIDIDTNTIRNVSNQTTNTYDGILLEVNTDNLTMARIQDNDIWDDRGGSKKMRDGIRLTVASGRTLTGLIISGNQIIGQTGTSKVNIVNSGTLTLDHLVNPYIIRPPFGSSSGSTYVLRYYSNTGLLATATESLVQATIPFNLRIVRALAKMSVNSLNASTTVSLRDDAANATGTLLTILAGSTAEVDSGSLSTLVAAGSKINLMVDTSTSSTGSWLMNHFEITGYME